MAAPTEAEYLVFIRNVMGVPTAALPDNAPIIGYTFSVALATVYAPMACITGTVMGTWTIYEIAVYNLAGDLLINYAPDQTGETYFADLRREFGIYTFIAGVISATYDQGTGQTMTVADWSKTLTLSDLQRLKTPYGKRYLELAQSSGNLWGLS